jgi:hypothetical protein
VTAILSLPFLHIAWLGEKLNFALLVLVGVAVYGAFMYQVSRAQLTAALGSLFAHRP